MSNWQLAKAFTAKVAKVAKKLLVEMIVQTRSVKTKSYG
jgi:hypothetical protein